jgi:RNA polymerase sigma-70 factor (ECF subfamily)
MSNELTHTEKAPGEISPGPSALGSSGIEQRLTSQDNQRPDRVEPTAHETVPFTPEPGEAALLARLRAQDDSAFELLVRTHTPKLLAVARRISRNEPDAEDVVQEAYLSAFRAIDSFDGRSSLGTWLHRIVVNAALSRARKASMRALPSIDELLPRFDGGNHERSPSPWRTVTPGDDSHSEVKQAVHTAIEKLPEEFRVVMILKDIVGLESTEIAQALDISNALVRQRVHRARQAMLTLLSPALQEAPQ